MPKAYFVKFIHPKPVPYSALENRKAVQHTLQVLMKNTIKSNDCDKLFMGDFFKNLPYNLYDLNKLSKDITDYNEEHYKIKFIPNEIQLRASLYLLWLKKKERVFKTEYGFYLLQADFQQKFIELYKLVYKKHRCEVLYISDNTIYDLYDNFNINNY